MSKTVMVIKRLIKPFFVNNNAIKVSKENYCRNLRNELFPAIKKVVKRDGWIFAQDGAPSPRSHLVQEFFKTKLCRRIASILI